MALYIWIHTRFTDRYKIANDVSNLCMQCIVFVYFPTSSPKPVTHHLPGWNQYLTLVASILIFLLSREDPAWFKLFRCPVSDDPLCVVRMRVLAYVRAHMCFAALRSLNQLTMIPYLDLLRQTMENFYVEG